MRFSIKRSDVREFCFGVGVWALLLAATQVGAATPTLTVGSAATGDLGGVAPHGQVDSALGDLFVFTQEYAASKGYRLGPGASVTLRNATGRAMQEIAGLSADEREGRMAEAKKNIARFVDGMIAAAQQIPGYADRNPGVIGEATFATAARWLCPLWPICE